MEWIFRCRGVQHSDHYFDDYITFGPAGFDVREKSLRIMQKTCEELGVPLAIEKLEGPTGHYPAHIPRHRADHSYRNSLAAR